MNAFLDALTLAQDLIRCPSVTPADAGALGVLAAALEPFGFRCEIMRFEDEGTPPVDNLYARLGTAAPVLCFAGHTDVVPPGDPAAWSADPFAGRIEDGLLIGRGANDMNTHPSVGMRSPAANCDLANARPNERWLTMNSIRRRFKPMRNASNKDSAVWACCVACRMAALTWKTPTVSSNRGTPENER